jgi:hypothetical protein
VYSPYTIPLTRVVAVKPSICAPAATGFVTVLYANKGVGRELRPVYRIPPRRRPIADLPPLK